MRKTQLSIEVGKTFSTLFYNKKKTQNQFMFKAQKL